MRPINSASPNKYPITNFASVDRDKTRVNSYASQFLKPEDISSPISNTKPLLTSSNDVLALKKLVIQLDQRVTQQNETITIIRTELEKIRETNFDLMEKLKNQNFPSSPNSLNHDKKVVDEQKKFKLDLSQLANKFSEMKVDYETKQMSLEEKVRALQVSFENRMKIFFESKLEFENIYMSLHQLANEINNIKVGNHSTNIINETYHVDSNGYLLDSNNNYMLDKGEMVKLNEKQINFLKQHHKLI